MANPQMTCRCGAVYDAIETKGPSFGDESFKCLLCGVELVSWTGSNVAQFRLIRRPETDRE